MALKPLVLQLYGRIIRSAYKWEAKDPLQTSIEKSYIIEEARKLFGANKSLDNSNQIHQCILEGESRLEMAIHYRTPYPRPVNFPPYALASKGGKANQRRKEKSRPIYIKSIDTPN